MFWGHCILFVIPLQPFAVGAGVPEEVVDRLFESLFQDHYRPALCEAEVDFLRSAMQIAVDELEI